MKLLNNRELKFFHITKTGGTSIEKVGMKNNLLWGIDDENLLINCNGNNNSFWHNPVSYYSDNFINKYDWFIVCRNPYGRIISEYHCNWGGIGLLEQSHDIKQFNKFVRKNIINRNNSKNHGHYLEQYLYYKKGFNVVRFENLKKDFRKLMLKYNKNIFLNFHVYKKEKIYNIVDFDKETIELINKIYHKDFVLFNYDKM